VTSHSIRTNFSDAAAKLRRGAFIGATAAMVGLAALSPASAQQVPVNNTTQTTQGVDKGNCGAFITFMLEEARLYSNEMSKGFLLRMSRFSRSGCKPYDADGEIQLVTETRRDAISYGVALTRMGRYDIIGKSGVRHCHRPDGSTCPAVTTGAAATPRPSGS
jgi:hypothetical protein